MKQLFLFLILCATAGTLRAESLLPLLSKRAVDSLRTRLWHTPPSRERVDQLVLLSTDMLIRNSDAVV